MAASAQGRWEPGIGDPSLFGWITVVAYAAAFVFCCLSTCKARAGPHRQFWLFLAVTMAVLGVNKQLDLQSWLTQVMRDFAHASGWYARRRLVQVIFIGWLALTGLVLAGWLQNRLLHLDQYARSAAIGFVFLMVFVVIRAASFHHIDHLLGISFDGLRINVLLELTGIGIIAVAAFLRCRLAPVAASTPARSRHCA
ncbi:MAG: hypothetical protein RL211_449 [Pseudomonadota bacterium]|jgi:hypothetical protein